MFTKIRNVIKSRTTRYLVVNIAAMMAAGAVVDYLASELDSPAIKVVRGIIVVGGAMYAAELANDVLDSVLEERDRMYP